VNYKFEIGQSVKLLAIDVDAVIVSQVVSSSGLPAASKAVAKGKTTSE
jgi:hypothetical protein